jgi:hypothetical protein
VQLMTDNVAPLSSANYNELRRGAKAARIRREEARAELKRHGERHGCRDGNARLLRQGRSAWFAGSPAIRSGNRISGNSV